MQRPPKAITKSQTKSGSQAKTGSKGRGESAVSLTLDNARHLPELCGPHDRYLAMIEQDLDVYVVARGNRLDVQGSKASCQLALDVLNDLSARLDRELKIEDADVSAAIRMAASGAEGGPRLTSASDKHLLVTPKKKISARSPVQATYIDAIRDRELVFGIGPAGTGKTYLAVVIGAMMLLQNKVRRLILSRPAVEAGERLGFLPGDLKEKIDPYLRPLYDALYDVMPGEQINRKLEAGDIEVAPLAFMRGRTLSDAFVILDEAQNTTPIQMKMFLTRLGENSRMVVTGDPTQIDLPKFGNETPKSGLSEALTLLEKVDGIDIVRFTKRDVVRHALVSKIVEAYDRQSQTRLSRGKKG